MRTNTIEHFWELVEKTDSCWVWYGSISTNGYAVFRFNGRSMQAHRLMYELEVGPIPDGLLIDHLCRNKPCINPSHLEPVTNQENIRRGAVGVLRHLFPKQKQKTHCKRGHELTPDNVKVGVKNKITGRVGRQCYTCFLDYKREWNKRKKLEDYRNAK